MDGFGCPGNYPRTRRQAAGVVTPSPTSPKSFFVSSCAPFVRVRAAFLVVNYWCTVAVVIPGMFLCSKARHLRRTSRQYPPLPPLPDDASFDSSVWILMLTPIPVTRMLLFLYCCRAFVCVPFPISCVASTRPSLGCRFTFGPLRLSLSLSPPNGLPPRAKHTTQCDCVYSLTIMVNTDNMVQHGADAIEIGLSRPGAVWVGVTEIQGSCVAMLRLHC